MGEHSNPSTAGGEAQFVAPTPRLRERYPDDPRRVDAHRSSQLQRVAQMAARAQAAQDFSNAESSGSASDANPPRVSSPVAAHSAGSSEAQRRQLSREEWLKRELDAERARKRSESRSARRIEQLKSDVHPFSPRREETLMRARQAARGKTIEARAANVRRLLVELQSNAATAYIAIGIKRICDRMGWSPVELAARRRLCMLLFLRELAVPHCWNAQYVRPQRRRGSRRLAKPERLGEHLGAVRKYTPCARAIDQRKVLTSVLAAEGHCPEDDQSCNVKTVQRALRDLEDVSLVQSVQVPLSAAEPWELGQRQADGTRWAFNRYYVATPGSPKPALMGFWSADDPNGAAVLERPWAGMRAAVPPDPGPPL